MSFDRKIMLLSLTSALQFLRFTIFDQQCSAGLKPLNHKNTLSNVTLTNNRTHTFMDIDACAAIKLNSDPGERYLNCVQLPAC
jgi:hypothetical protein